MHVLLRPIARYEERALNYRDAPIGGTRPPGPRRMQSGSDGRGPGGGHAQFPLSIHQLVALSRPRWLALRPVSRRYSGCRPSASTPFYGTKVVQLAALSIVVAKVPSSNIFHGVNDRDKNHADDSPKL